MGNTEDGKSSKSDKSSSPATPDQTINNNIHVYPDWAAVQAYYGPRVALPPYYNSPMAPGHAPHPYIWGPPQPMMSPYPYAAMYSPGGVYAHPAVPIGSLHTHGPGVPASSVGAAPLGPETPTKSSASTDNGLMTKLKRFDGLAMSIGNGNGSGESANSGEHGLSQSAETEGSSGGSDGDTVRGKKRSREGTPNTGVDQKPATQASGLPNGEVNASSPKVLGAAIALASEKPVVSAGMSADLTHAPAFDTAKTNPAVQQSCAVVPTEAWLQNERELKRERRKQSNRESARRSRLRKQAESEELARKVESLTADNVALKSEISQLSAKSEKLMVENAAIIEKLKNAEIGHTQEITLNNIPEKKSAIVSTENLLSRVNNSDKNAGEGGEPYTSKLHQLLDSSPRSNAVVAS